MKPLILPPGFNDNVRYRGRAFHIQTESSASLESLNVLTQLFADGGRVVKSLRRDFSHARQRSDAADVVRHAMREQHKAMYRALRGGKFDKQLEAMLGELTPATDPPPSLRAELSSLPASVSGSERELMAHRARETVRAPPEFADEPPAHNAPTVVPPPSEAPISEALSHSGAASLRRTDPGLGFPESEIAAVTPRVDRSAAERQKPRAGRPRLRAPEADPELDASLEAAVLEYLRTHNPKPR